MNSRSIVNLGLVLLLGGLVLMVVYEPGKKPPAAPPTLTSFNKQDIRRIVIGNSNGPSVVIEKQNAGWRVESPAAIKADSARIDKLLGIVSAASHAGFAVKPGELAKYELDPPRAWLELNDKRISFGATEPVNHRRYVLVDNRVHLITDLFYHYLVTEVPSWFSNRLLPADDAPVMLKLPSFSLEQQPNGSWHSSAAAPGVSADSLNLFVDSWRRARALRVSLAGEKKAGKPIEILLGSGARIVFALLEDGEEVSLLRADLGVQYQLSPENGKRLLTLPAPAEKAAPDNGAPRAAH
jgi:hypothetical protein